MAAPRVPRKQAADRQVEVPLIQTEKLADRAQSGAVVQGKVSVALTVPRLKRN